MVKLLNVVIYLYIIEKRSQHHQTSRVCCSLKYDNQIQITIAQCVNRGYQNFFCFFSRFFCINPLLIGRYDDLSWVPRGTQPIFGVFGGQWVPLGAPKGRGILGDWRVETVSQSIVNIFQWIWLIQYSISVLRLHFCKFQNILSLHN